MYIAVKGFFDKGKITLLEDAPEFEKANVIIIFQPEIQKDAAGHKFDFAKLGAFGMWKSHSGIKDELKFANELRNQWERDHERESSD